MKATPESASTTAPARGEVPSAGDEALPTDPEALYQAGALANRQRAWERSVAIGEALIRGFPRTIHAVRGLTLIYWGRRSKDDAEARAQLDGLAARLAEVAPMSPAMDRAYKEAAVELRARIEIDLGGLAVKRGRDGDPRGFEECARIFRGLVAEALDDELAPIVLFNAARCGEPLYRIGEAIALYRQVAEVYPQSYYAEASLESLADITLALARFREAAGWMERFAERHSKSPRAPELLQRAAAIRIALEDPEARRDVELLERYYGGKDPKRAAAIAWGSRVLAHTDDQRIAHAEAYIKRYAKAGGADRWLAAEATIGQIEWARSCPGGQVNGLCLAARPEAKAKGKVRRCAEPTSWIVRARTKSADKAQARFRTVDKGSKAARIAIPEHEPWRGREYADAVAGARMAAIDRDLEEAMKIEPPTGLRFTVDPRAPEATRRAQIAARDESMRRFKEYYTARERAGSELLSRYAGLRAEKSSLAVTLDVPYRMGLLHEHFADQLLSVELPREVTDPQAQKAYCDVLREHAEPLLKAAQDAYEFCVVRAVEYQAFSDATRACEAAMVRLDRKRWPPLLEYVGEPGPAGEVPPRSVGIEEDPKAYQFDESAAASRESSEGSSSSAPGEGTAALEEASRGSLRPRMAQGEVLRSRRDPRSRGETGQASPRPPRHLGPVPRDR